MKFRLFLERVLHNWPAKILCLAGAIILFVVYRMTSLEFRYFSIPLSVRGAGELVPASELPRMVRVSLRGEPNSLSPVMEDDIEAWLDLSLIEGEGIHKTVVRVNKKGAAAGIEPLEIHVEPAEISLAMEYRDERMVSVSPSFRGYVETGWELSSWAMEPALVTVSGPASRIARLEALSSELIELGGRKDSFTQRVRLVNLDPLVSVSGEGAVLFTGKITETSLTRDFDQLPLAIRSLDERFEASLDPGTISLRLQGPWPRLEAWEALGGTLSVDASSIKRPGEYLLPVESRLPAWAQVLRMEPAEIRVVVAIREGDALE